MDVVLTQPSGAAASARASRPLPPLGAAAVVCLALMGLLLVVVSLPPGYRLAFGQTEVRAWDAVLLADGLLYIGAAVLIGAFRSRLGIGLGLVLAMTGFALTLAMAVGNDNLGSGLGDVSRRQLVAGGGLAAVHAIALAGCLAAARRWGMLPQLSRDAALAAAVLAGLGLAMSLGSSGGSFAILLSRTDTTDWFREVHGWLPFSHFLAVAAVVLRGRLAMPFAALVSAGGLVLASAMLVSLALFRGGPLELLDSVALWVVFLVGYLIAAAAAIRSSRRE